MRQVEEEQIGIPYISDPRLYMFPMDLMSNAVYHCNSEGEKIRTSILVDDLRLCGAIENIELTDVVDSEMGETLVLVDFLPKRLLHKPTEIIRVYSYNDDGSIHQFEEGKDYEIDYERGTIRRLVTSSIPNYSDHKVIYSNGKFTWVYDPSDQGGTNPESNKEYQICIDYRYRVPLEAENRINDSSEYLSASLRRKLLNGDNILIALCGDSIGAGGDTDGKGIFLNYLSETLEEKFGMIVDTENLSVAGTSRSLLKENLANIISMKPDLLMIEFGMNDHCGKEASSEENLRSYKEDIGDIVDTLRQNDIDIVLIGFFQQNTTWDAENMDATISYNNALREIANQENVYYADVYDAFDRLGYIKPLSRDVMADYIHHPTEWGHKIYFSCLIDLFNIDNRWKPDDLEYYIFIN